MKYRIQEVTTIEVAYELEAENSATALSRVTNGNMDTGVTTIKQATSKNTYIETVHEELH